MNGAQSAARVQRVGESSQDVLRVHVMITRCVLRIGAVALGAAFEVGSVCKVVRKTLADGSFIEREVGRQVVHESRLPTDSTWFGELVGGGIAAVYLRITQRGFSLIIGEVLARSRVWTQNVAATGDRQAFSASHVAIAGCCSKSRPVWTTNLRYTAWVGRYSSLVLPVVVGHDSIRTLLLQVEVVILQVRVEWRAA